MKNSGKKAGLTKKLKMKFIVLTTVILAVVLLINNTEVKNKTYKLVLNTLLDRSVPELSVCEASNTRFVVLDAREKKEYNVSKIENARWVGFSDFSAERVKDIPKTTEIMVYCSVGYRSEKIVEKLKATGFENIYNLYGGIFEWVNQGKPVVNSFNQPTDSVHAYNKVWGIWLQRGIKVYQ